jgi:hypothetical protein
MEERLVEKLLKSGEESTAKLIEKDTKTELLDTSFLTDGKIYRVTKFHLTRPLILYIGVDSKETAYYLNGNKSKFLKFISKSNLKLNKKETIIEYVKLYLKIVISPNKRFEVLESINDLKQRPNLSEENKKKFADFQEKFRSLIKSAECQDKNCVLFAVKNQDLVKLELQIDDSGNVNIKETTLEKNLLIPYAL